MVVMRLKKKRMKLIFKYAQVSIPFIWVGFICAISFMEAWLKFTPPNVSLVIGLSIGKVVFSALNKVELVAAILLGVFLLFERQWNWHSEIFYMMAIVILFIQSIWILPLLSERVDIYLDGSTPPPSSIHLVFIALEGIKTIVLIMYGIKHLTVWKT
jgi:hypothetical protein